MGACVDSKRLRDGKLTDAEQASIGSAAATISVLPLQVDDEATRTISQIRAGARTIARREALGLIVVDYLQLVEVVTNHDNRERQVAQISVGLKTLAKELRTPVIACAQLNRNAEFRVDHRPLLGDLRESGQLEQDADVVLLLHRPSYYESQQMPKKPCAEESPKEPESDEVILAKQRNGPTATIYVTFDGRTMRFLNNDEA
jgi:replicative DNA helicase